MDGQHQSFDVCIICALPEEASALIDEFSARCGVSFTQAFRNSNQLAYRQAAIQNQRGESLIIFVTWLSRMGPIRTALDLLPLLQEIKPRFVAMTGVCAGNQSTVKLGDLIVATEAYHPEEGKVTVGRNEQPVHLPETKTMGASTRVIQYVQRFDSWREPVRTLQRPPGDPVEAATDEAVCHLGVMASSMAVHSDNPFPLWTTQHHRKTIGLDMEAAVFYTALHDFPLIHGLVVKGVSDYGDSSKNDAYHDYAARASAVYLLHFIQEYVTEETMPRRSAELPPIFAVQAQRDMLFTGRETFLQSLHQRLAPGSITAITQAISGMGGIGKTHTAIEYAYRFRASYQAVLWLAADSWQSTLSGCFTLASQLGLPEEKEADRVLAAIQRWLREHHRWLLILDNVEQVQEVVSRLLPADHQGCVLFTTRVQHIEPFAQTQVMDLMPEAEGVLFLLRRTALLAPTAGLDQATAVQLEEARLIWELLDGLPLALDQASAYILETGCSFSAYREQYKTRRAALLNRRGWRVVGHEESVATTLALAVEKVEARSSLATKLLRVCSFLNSEAIPEELFSEGANVLELRLTPNESMDEAFGILQDYSLVQRNREKQMLSIHRLVQVVLQDALKDAERFTWAERVVFAVNAAFPHVEYSAWPQCERLLLQALTTRQIIEQYRIASEEAARLLHETASYLRDRARYKEAESLFLRALSIREQLLGTEHPDVAATLNNLALIYHRQGNSSEAQRLYLRALRIWERALGLEHSLVAYTLNNLAVLFSDQGKYKEAEPLFQRALSIREKLLGTEHPDVAVTLNNLAFLSYNLGNAEKALQLFKRALRVFELHLGNEHPHVATTLTNLAALSYEQEKYEEAEQFSQRALSIREKLLGAEHPDMGYPLINLADLYRKQGKYKEAEPLFQRAQSIWEKAWGSEHSTVAYALTGLATLYQEQGKFEEAESLFQRVLHIRQQAEGPRHPEVAETMHDLALLWELQGHSKEASVWYTHALTLREQVLGEHHPKTMETRTRLITLLHTMGQHEEAIQLEAIQLEAKGE